jgi:hypothetical protein
MDNPETHTTLNTQDTGQRPYCLYTVSCVCCMCLWIVHYWIPLRLSLTCTYCLYTTKEETNNGQSRETYNIGYTRHRTKTISKR